MSPILVTGFEPFAGAKLNPSELVLAELDGDDRLITAVLPVSYREATEQLLTLLEDLEPRAVICLGQAEGRDAISIERVAVNNDDAPLADNTGDTRSGQPIITGGVSAYFSSLPIAEMVEAVQAKGIPVEISQSAGTFVCNHIFYMLQNALAETTIPSGFVHLPLVEEQASEFPGKPTLTLADEVRAVRAMIRVLR